MVEQLLGPGIRFQNTKLNMKSPGFGSPVEWHQDWAFYPHTNDDVLAAGLAIDDMMLANGCLMVIPGSHREAVLNHHQDGVFVGAVPPAGLAEGRPRRASRRGHLLAPRPPASRVCAQHLRPATAVPAVRVLQRRRVAAPRRG